MSQWEIRQGDALALLREMPAGSVDAIVTDPPYGLGFMGKKWDSFTPGDSPMRRTAERDAVNAGASRQGGRQRACSDYAKRQARDMRAFQDSMEAWATEALRVAKPGAHLVAFGGSRTYHRLACAIEDAGWEVRDCLMWLYGSGFPKSLDVSKAIDKAAGVEREDKFEGAFTRRAGPTGNVKCAKCGKWLVSGSPCVCPRPQDQPKTHDARELSGWGTALKPAHEPIILARKPFSGTVAANVLEHGTGAVNVDGCRVEMSETWDGGGPAVPRESGIGYASSSSSSSHPLGRWPANVLLDEEAAAALDEQSGERSSGYMAAGTQREGIGYRGGLGCEVRNSTHGDRGGASRFFYTAKASAGERHAAGRNTHPTVKPVDLMRWLCRLVTPRGGLVLDPFTGSGSTGVAALAEGFRFLGLEREADYCAMARRRIAGPLFAEHSA